MDYEYTSSNGYTGRIYGEKQFSIFDSEGREVLHTYSRAFDTYEALKESVDTFPELVKILQRQNKFDDQDAK